jgi:hypothetical protein
LPAGSPLVFKQANLGVERRILRDNDQMIHGIQPKADGIKEFVVWKGKRKEHRDTRRACLIRLQRNSDPHRYRERFRSSARHRIFNPAPYPLVVKHRGLQ